MLEVCSLCFDYQDKPLLEQINFTLRAGQLLHLRGGNGAGKTTLLKLLAGLLHPSEGEIRYQGKPVRNNLVIYQQKICYVGHKTGIHPLLTVKENSLFDMHWGRREVAFDSLLEEFGLQGLDHELCSHLSAGQRRRVGLLRIAMTNARLWLLDEPLVALDKEAVKVLVGHLEDHLAQGGQVIITSHQKLPLMQADCLEYNL
ncbi:MULTISPECIES: cytochrome c biogenesis heme-transporting ATPase CcmA [unclassified Legionella]|uniref:cytochrome c biogenesis heme-transporting ATPase CcmA n=1 Tax=unclassified Legionella TaxID=2622702 RepID=UPI0010544E5E|nr:MULTISPECIES: cytochrome c biogenesis heme-transporting ATPase CcmA [unclassified Legionella]MDI9818582.1 cytochrome c biogenesis heme-transporting ATPase CcmA [Legionella sp. PL877]